MFNKPFSFNGRISRTEFGLSFLIYIPILLYQEFAYLIGFILGFMNKRIGNIFNLNLVFILVILLYFFFFWFAFAQGTKRCHDLGKNGWWQAIPFYFLWMIFAKGETGSNKWGYNRIAGVDNQSDAIQNIPLSSSILETSNSNEIGTNENIGTDFSSSFMSSKSDILKVDHIDALLHTDSDIYIKFIIDYSSFTKVLIDPNIILTAKEDGTISNIYYRLSGDRHFKVVNKTTSRDNLKSLINRFDLVNSNTLRFFGPSLSPFQIEKCKVGAWERIEEFWDNIENQV